METETVKTVENIKAFLPLTLMEGKRSLLHLESSGEAKEYVALCSINKKNEKLAEFLYKAANSHYELLEALNNIMTICYKVDSGEIHRTDEISSLIGSEINNALSKSNLLTK